MHAQAFYEVCSDIPLDMNGGPNNKPFYVNSKHKSADAFCAAVIGPEGRCFRGPVPSGRDAKCKCPSLTCHLDADMMANWEDVEDAVI